MNSDEWPCSASARQAAKCMYAKWLIFCGVKTIRDRCPSVRQEDASCKITKRTRLVRVFLTVHLSPLILWSQAKVRHLCETITHYISWAYTVWEVSICLVCALFFLTSFVFLKSSVCLSLPLWCTNRLVSHFPLEENDGLGVWLIIHCRQKLILQYKGNANLNEQIITKWTRNN